MRIVWGCMYSFLKINRFTLSIEKLESRNTVSLSSEEYFQITKTKFDEMSEPLEEMKKLFPLSFRDLKIVSMDFDLLINEIVFMRRITYFKDARYSESLFGDECYSSITLLSIISESICLLYVILIIIKQMSDVVALMNTMLER